MENEKTDVTENSSDGSIKDDFIRIVESGLCRDSLYHILFEASPFGIIVVSKEGDIELFNTNAPRILGCKKQDLTDKKIFDIGLFSEEEYEDLVRLATKEYDNKGLRPVAHEINGTDYCMEITPIYGNPEKETPDRTVILIRDCTEGSESYPNNLAEQNAFLDNVQSLADLGAWIIDIPKNEIRISRAVRKIFGLENERSRLALPELFDKFIPSEEHSKIASSIKFAVENMSRFTIEHRIKRENGTIRYIRTTGKVFRTIQNKPASLIGAMNDITDITEYQSALTESLTITDSMLDASDNGVVIFDFDNKIKSYNRQFLEIMGLQGKKIIGMNLKDFIETINSKIVDAGLEIETYETFQKDEKAVIRTNVNTIKGRNVSIKAKNSEFFFGKHTMFWVFKDVTKWIENQNQLITSNKNLKFAVSNLERTAQNMQEAQKEAEKSKELQAILVSNLSHDLRSPLSTILSFSELIEKEGLNESQKESMEVIKSRSNDLLFLINDLLDFSKIQAGRPDIRKTKFSVKQEIVDILGSVRPKADAKNLKLNFDIAEDTPEGIVQDRNRIRQILINLIDNAIKFTDSGEVSISVDATESNTADGNIDLLIEVRDTGIGIPAEEQKAIFNPFIRSSNLDTSKTGTGLGLAIVKLLVPLLGGNIYLKSTEGLGTVFSIILKNVKPCQYDFTEPSQAENRLEGKKIAFLLHEKAERKIYESYFSTGETVFYADCKTLLEEIDELRPDIIIEEPSQVGKAACEYIKIINSDRNLGIPTIALTGNIESEVIDKLKEVYDEVLIHPVTKGKLIESAGKLTSYSLYTPVSAADSPMKRIDRIFDRLDDAQKLYITERLGEIKTKTEDAESSFILSVIDEYAEYISGIATIINFDFFAYVSKKLRKGIEKYNIDIILSVFAEMNLFINKVEETDNE